MSEENKVTDTIPEGTEVGVRGEIRRVLPDGTYMVGIPCLQVLCSTDTRSQVSALVQLTKEQLVDIAAETQQGRIEGREQGMNEAWTMARKLINASEEELGEAFFDTSVKSIFDDYTAGDAIHAWNQYRHEEQNIETGDLVKYFGKPALVTRKMDDDSYCLLFSNGFTVRSWREDIRRTDTHMDSNDMKEFLSLISIDGK